MVNGLYIGKLAPIHKGHVRIIDQALDECKNLTIFIYNSLEFDEAHPALDKILRAYWVKRMYPEADVRVGYNPPPDDYTREGDLLHAEYIKRHMPYEIHAVYGGENWVHNIADGLEATARHLPRDGKGISASKIRENPMEYAWYMSPEVRDYMLVHYGNDQGLRI